MIDPKWDWCGRWDLQSRVPKIGVWNPTRTWRPSWTPPRTPFAAALYVTTDELLKSRPELAPWRPAVGIKPQVSDAELVTLAVLAAMLGFACETRWVR